VIFAILKDLLHHDVFQWMSEDRYFRPQKFESSLQEQLDKVCKCDWQL